MSPTNRSARAQNYNMLGYHVERSLLSAAECDAIKDAFARVHTEGVPGYYEAHPEGMDDGFHHVFHPGDPLAKYPRVNHPHRFVPIAKQYLLDGRIFDVLEDLLGEPALTAQSMYYFKPPGGRGQAFHQDNFYLNVQPGNCIAAWIAIDDADEENGGLEVIPKTNNIPIICPNMNADDRVSFSKEIVPMEELEQVMHLTGNGPVEKHKLRLKRGDVLFFNGNVVHGSGPNRSADRFRRSLICHYVSASCEHLAWYYHPLFDRHGVEQVRGTTEMGGPCGTEQAEPH